MAIPTRILEEIKNSELDAENFYSIYGKENIEAALNDLKKSDEEILNTYSVEAMKAAVSAKMNQKKAAGNNEAKNNILQFPTATRFISYAAAAVLLAAIVIPAGLKNSKIKAGSSIPTERVKGVSVARTATSPAINLYR